MNRLLLAGLTLLCVAHRGATTAQQDQVSLKDLPDVQMGAFRVDPYIRAATALQSLGKDKASDTLLKLSKNREQVHQVVVLCRMLFVKKAKGEFRRPGIGAALFLGGTDYADWPLEPIELVDGVPFLITRGYTLLGQAEPAEKYVRYCIQQCDWNDGQFKPKTEQEKRKALDKLLASSKWKVQLNEQEKTLLSSQTR